MLDKTEPLCPIFEVMVGNIHWVLLMFELQFQAPNGLDSMRLLVLSVSMLSLGKLRLNEVKKLACGSITCKWRCQDWNPSNLASEAVPLACRPMDSIDARKKGACPGVRANREMIAGHVGSRTGDSGQIRGLSVLYT